MNPINIKNISISLFNFALLFFLILSVQTIVNAQADTACAKEGERCQFQGTRLVRYGANGVFISKSLTGGAACNTSTFGSDPVPNVVKQCYVAAAGKTRVLEVVYVIPRGQTAKPDAVAAFTAIMKLVQNHYLKQLGVTFELKEPLVTIINTNDDAATAVDWNRNVSLIKSQVGDDYLNKENLIYSVIEGSQGAGGGSWGIVKMTGGFWNTAYNVYKTDPTKLVNELHGWSHELGHSFGLMHTEDARACFTKNGVDIGRLPSLIMQKTNDLGSFYNYTFISQEKKLLLDESYLPDCRPLRNEPGGTERPFAKTYFRVTSVPDPTPAPVQQARSITFKNEAGYVAKMMVMYFESGPGGAPMPKTLFTDNIPVGQSRTLDIPASAPNMQITVNLIGTATTNNNFFSRQLDGRFSGNQCFKAWGTLFSPQGGNCQ